ncbi:hypothetical protein VUR80DRAFT_2348 [Thermomyces stellatus]
MRQPIQWIHRSRKRLILLKAERCQGRKRVTQPKGVGWRAEEPPRLGIKSGCGVFRKGDPGKWLQVGWEGFVICGSIFAGTSSSVPADVGFCPSYEVTNSRCRPISMGWWYYFLDPALQKAAGSQTRPFSPRESKFPGDGENCTPFRCQCEGRNKQVGILSVEIRCRDAFVSLKTAASQIAHSYFPGFA